MLLVHVTRVDERRELLQAGCNRPSAEHIVSELGEDEHLVTLMSQNTQALCKILELC
jgi:hypothetical protein